MKRTFQSPAAAGLLIAALVALPQAASADDAAEHSAHSAPLLAQSSPLPDLPGIDEDALSEAARQSIERFMEVLGPLMQEFGAMIDDLPQYEAPEVLPNGDIIIRRKRKGPGAEDKIDT
ncbi:MAG: hypothetical protein AAFV62_10080 [Pseudomonadota bacterium]